MHRTTGRQRLAGEHEPGLDLVVLQRDLGTAILFFGLFVAMLYLATGRLSWIILGLIFVAAGGFVASQTFGHVAARLDSWIHAFDPEIYDAPVGGSRQIVQGLFGLASGGLFGQGWGQGRPDLVSYANSDMIITAFGEELGVLYQAVDDLLDGDGYGLPQTREWTRLERESEQRQLRLNQLTEELDQEVRVLLGDERREELEAIEVNLAQIGERLRGLHKAGGGLELP